MNFKGGVIIIGSLLWEKTPIREKWRLVFLKPVSTKSTVPLRIRYGRESLKNRKGTYTMLFSNHPTTLTGNGYTVDFIEPIKNFKMLEKQVFGLAHAEGICGEGEYIINKNWGAIGLLLNPNIDKKDKVNAELVKTLWMQLYNKYQDNFIADQYKIEDEEPVINQDGLLNIEWVKEMDDFDFLIASPVIAQPRVLLTSEQVANKMIEKDYQDYFLSNKKEGIATFQDEEIQRFLEKQKAKSSPH